MANKLFKDAKELMHAFNLTVNILSEYGDDIYIEDECSKDILTYGDARKISNAKKYKMPIIDTGSQSVYPVNDSKMLDILIDKARDKNDDSDPIDRRGDGALMKVSVKLIKTVAKMIKYKVTEVRSMSAGHRHAGDIAIILEIVNKLTRSRAAAAPKAKKATAPPPPPPIDLKMAKSLLKKYHKVFDRLYVKIDVPQKFYLANVPKAHSLKMSDIKNLVKDKFAYLYVIQPQSYENVSKLQKTDEDIVDSHFADTDKLATTGSGSDKWVKVTDAFTRWLEKLIEKMEKLLAKAK
jgi:hypothetical protein